MRYWGKNIEIDAAFYNTDAGKKLLPTEAEMMFLRSSGSFYQSEGIIEIYEKTVQDMMREIEKNSIGIILVTAINAMPRKLRIIPLTSKEQSQLNRTPFTNCVGDINPRGNESVIWFDPWSKMANLFSGTGVSPYQILVHELHHALRQMRGLWTLAGRVGNFPFVEELYSNMFENIYLSAAGQPQRMLGAYDQNVPLGSRTDKDYYNEYSKEIEKWCSDLPDLSNKLRLIHGIWNPIRVSRGI